MLTTKKNVGYIMQYMAITCLFKLKSRSLIGRTGMKKLAIEYPIKQAKVANTKSPFEHSLQKLI